MEKRYKVINKNETETTINILYKESLLSIYTNEIQLQRELCNCIGEPTEEYIKGRSIIGSRWDISLNEKSKITRIILKANIFKI